MPAAALVPSLLSLAFFGSFAAILGWGAWYSRGQPDRRTP
jgi:hypothetical protein